ncbi:aspartate aminotransferase family protein [Dactylosporangium fulvum]|uniref:Aminotransferase class III-fold pyridoxal phosphate-dependent enzyme n=1 Tax=Dactylosporangium fulvum TaxID=53359 RepID=A0ABY5W8W0_9ACTN|nr:aminotransferase class III-fold pyridoxal phosphate-dependent enzyme [Dactylosporangium fulvum]UWP85654.1 aminotransferase class III-fold pyridoxal phosphate-dependent enzyme [Dactylosporangium fulvum]
MSATSSHSSDKVAGAPDIDDLAARARAVIPSGTSRSTLYVPPAVPMARSGRSAWLTDESGSRVLDFNNNYTSLIHGHHFEPIQRAIAEALDEGTSFGLPTRREVALAEHLRDRTGHEQWRFSNSGTEAVMQAIRCARAVTGRDLIVRFEGSYHGTSDPVTDSDRPGITCAEHETVMVLPQGSLAALQTVFGDRGDDVAAVLIDLMPNRAGLEPADPEFINAVRQLTTRHGSLMIVDEVITFRLALNGLGPSYGIAPDLATFGKVIGGGLPVGALAGRTDIMSAFDAKTGPLVAWGGTFSANPLTMAAGLAAVQAYDQPAIDDLNSRGNQLRHCLSDAGVKVNGRGSLMRIMEKVDVSDLWWALYRRGVFAGTNALLSLSTAMTHEDLNLAADAIVDAVQAVRS